MSEPTDRDNLIEISIYHYGTDIERADQRHRFNGLADYEMAAAIEDIAKRAMAKSNCLALSPKETEVMAAARLIVRADEAGDIHTYKGLSVLWAEPFARALLGGARD